MSAMRLKDLITFTGADYLLDCKIYAGFGKEGVKYLVSGMWIEDNGNIVLVMDKEKEEKITR